MEPKLKTKTKKQQDSGFKLVLVESRIYRLARYYRRCKALPSAWKYKHENAAALISGV